MGVLSCEAVTEGGSGSCYVDWPYSSVGVRQGPRVRAPGWVAITRIPFAYGIFAALARLSRIADRSGKMFPRVATHNMFGATAVN